MASPKRDLLTPSGGKLYKDDDSVFDVPGFLDDITDGTSPVQAELNAGEAHIGTASSPDAPFEVTLTLDNASVYADGDVLFVTAEIANFMRVVGGTAFLQSFVVNDEDDQAGAFDVVFLKTNVGIGTINGAADIGANGDQVLGTVSVIASIYVDLASAQTATPELTQNIMLVSGAASKSIFIAGVSRDTKTYTTNGLKLRIGAIRN